MLYVLMPNYLKVVGDDPQKRVYLLPRDRHHHRHCHHHPHQSLSPTRASLISVPLSIQILGVKSI